MSNVEGMLGGTRCRECDHYDVPVRNFGCQRCGAHGSALAEVMLSGRGTVLAAVVLHEHPKMRLDEPVTVGSVLLDEGPMVRARLRETSRSPWFGVTVRAGQDERGLVFVRENGATT